MTDLVHFVSKYYLQHILYLLELISCISGFIFWKKIKTSFWKWFPFYLAIIVIVELTADYFTYTDNSAFRNSMYNNFSIPLEFLFFYWVYYRCATGKKKKTLVILCTVIYLIGFILDQVNFSKTNYFFDSFSYSIGNLVLLVCIISFFFQLLNSNDILHYKTSMIFWVSLGVLIFYLGSLPFYGFYNLLYKKYHALFIFYTYIMFACNWIMYSLFTVAFVWGKPK